MKTTYYAASSLDGYIAKADGDVTWLESLGISVEETGYDKFYASVDAIVMGRKTYEMIVSFAEWPYGDKPVWVCSTQEIEAIDGCNLQAGKTPVEACREAESMGAKHLWLVGGGLLAASFITEKQLDYLSITQMPILLGGGIRLVGYLEDQVSIKRTSMEAHPSGFTQMNFTIEY